MQSIEPVLADGADAVTAVLDAGLAPALGAERAARWRVERAGYRPTVHTLGHGEGILAAALTSGRPATAATKIVDLWTSPDAPDDAADRLVARVIAAAVERGDAAVKWELPEGAAVPASALAHGFVPLRAPWGAVGTEGTRGLVHWLVPLTHDEPGYYGQTTLFTCGAVAGLIASERYGSHGFAGETVPDRDLEIEFWRRASNYPACEPLGLAVTVQEHIGPSGAVEVALDHPGPVLLEDFTGFDYDFRAELQRESRKRAADLGILVADSRVAMTEVASRVAAGEQALLLIDEAPMHADPGPHWIVAHAAAGPYVVVEDPWVNTATGETWVDTHDLPIHVDDLERLVAWGPEGYRGVIFLSPR
ncbi:peptidase C39 family protein [Microbacterium schleiferi]|uniref:Peptidase C39 family protein n=1 Tax=Microbacterium schleiferi TaxID=69362 RepID=A0ABU7V555_9MICO